MKMDIPSPVLHSLFALNKAGFEAYIVGGCVRDALLGKEPFDWDITTSALPEQTKAVFAHYRTIETGIRHGTVTVLIEDMPLEITTYRVDGEYSDGRHPDSVKFTSHLEEDLCRRDFTINAMAYHPNVGLVDPYGGRQDLENKYIRCVGNPDKRFHEDALRIIRGLRFASTLSFSIEDNTSASVHSLAGLLKNVARERVSVEFIKLLCGSCAGTVIQQYHDVLKTTLPQPIDWIKVADVVDRVEPSPLLRLGIVLMNYPMDIVDSFCCSLRLSNEMKRSIIDLVRYRDLPLIAERSAICRALNCLGTELLFTLISIRSITDGFDYSYFIEEVTRIIDEGACYRLSDLAVTGNDLLDIGLTSGPIMGKTLDNLLDAVMDEKCANERDQLLKYALENPVQ